MTVRKSLICSALTPQYLNCGARDTKCHSCIPPGARNCLSIAFLVDLSFHNSSNSSTLSELNHSLNSPLFTVGTLTFSEGVPLPSTLSLIFPFEDKLYLLTYLHTHSDHHTPLGYSHSTHTDSVHPPDRRLPA